MSCRRMHARWLVTCTQLNVGSVADHLTMIIQLVDELLAFWSLEDYETTLEELEEALIVGTCR